MLKNLIEDCCVKSLIFFSITVPSLLRAYLKNLLQLFNILFYVLSESIIWFDTFYFHNKLTATYTIWNKDKKKILAMLEKAQLNKS
jgi:hypothetical protein